MSKAIDPDLARLLEDDSPHGASPDRRADGPLPYNEAAAIVGVEIDPQKLWRTEQVRGCDCLEVRTWSDGGGVPPVATANEWQHCPWCGKPLYEERVVTIPEWDSTDPGRPLLAGLSVVTTGHPDSPGLALTELGREAIRHGVRMIAGEIVVRTDAGSMARMADANSEMLSDARARVLKRLLPLGLWDARKFGLWAVFNQVR